MMSFKAMVVQIIYIVLLDVLNPCYTFNQRLTKRDQNPGASIPIYRQFWGELIFTEVHAVESTFLAETPRKIKKMPDELASF